MLERLVEDGFLRRQHFCHLAGEVLEQIEIVDGLDGAFRALQFERHLGAHGDGRGGHGADRNVVSRNVKQGLGLLRLPVVSSNDLDIRRGGRSV